MTVYANFNKIYGVWKIQKSAMYYSYLVMQYSEANRENQARQKDKP